eukprot:14702-Hanusia_phi.AAC.2
MPCSESREIEQLLKEKAQLQAQLHPSKRHGNQRAVSKTAKKLAANPGVEKKPPIDTLKREKEVKPSSVFGAC